MTRSLFAFLLFLFPASLFAQEWKTFVDTAGYFTAKYPSNWTNKIKQGNRVFFTSAADNESDKFFENINVGVSINEAFGNGASIKELMPAIINELENQFTSSKQESLRYFKWNNLEAAELIYSGNMVAVPDPKIRCTQWYCFYKSRMYVVTYVADASDTKHWEVAKKIMSSIVFK